MTSPTDVAIWNRLRCRVERRYRVRREVRQLGGRRYDFYRVADPNRLVEQVGDNRLGGWQPYWAEAWESGEALAARLAERDLAAQRVLDLGCGLGLAGTVAASRGARVLFADAAPPALLFARLNSWPWRERVRLRRLDWRRDALAGPLFPLIVGADILYDPEDWPFLERFWRRHLRGGGEVLLGEPGRAASVCFPAWLRERGWRVSECVVASTAGGKGVRVLAATPAC